MNLSELIDLILEIVQMPINYLLSPSKRIFLVYLLTSFLLALFVFFRRKKFLSKLL